MTRASLLLVIFYSCCWSASSVAGALDVTVLRAKTGDIRSECHALSTSGSDALQWIGADFTTESSAQFRDFHVDNPNRGCPESRYGIFCRNVETDWTKGNNLDVDVPPFTDVRWESLPIVQTWENWRYEHNKHAVSVPSVTFSVKGYSDASIKFSGDAGDGYIVTLGDTGSSFRASVHKCDAGGRCQRRADSTQGNVLNGSEWRHFTVSVRNGAISLTTLDPRPGTVVTWRDTQRPIPNKFVSFRSGSKQRPVSWKLHKRDFLYIKQLDFKGISKYIQGSVKEQGNTVCLSFWYYLDPVDDLELWVTVSGQAPFVIKGRKSEGKIWRRYAEEYTQYSTDPHGLVQVTIEGVIPRTAPLNTVITVDDIRRCGPNEDVSHSLTIRGQNDLLCAPAFKSALIAGPPCSTEVKCYNGGSCFGNTCECMPGFTGRYCEKGCESSSNFGRNCTGKCKDGSCRGMELCNPLMKKCGCAPGFTGIKCDAPCRMGYYGVDCGQRCGHCHSSDRCDTHTGTCIGGCAGNYRPPLCLLPPSYLKYEPYLLEATSRTLSIAIRLGTDNYLGEGDPLYYRVEYRRVPDDLYWHSGELMPIEHRDARDMSVPYTIRNLEKSSRYQMRVILEDSNAAVNRDVKTVTFETCRPISGPPRNVSIIQVTSRTITMAWMAPEIEDEKSCSTNHYVVTWYSDGMEESMTVDTTNATITNLPQLTKVQVRVRVVSQESTLCSSEPIYATTTEEPSKILVPALIGTAVVLLVVFAFALFFLRRCIVERRQRVKHEKYQKKVREWSYMKVSRNADSLQREEIPAQSSQVTDGASRLDVVLTKKPEVKPRRFEISKRGGT